MLIVAKSPAVWDKLEKIISVLAEVCILFICLDILSFRMGILPGFIAISALYFTVAACMLLYVAALVLLASRIITSRRIGLELLLLLMLLLAPVLAGFPLLGGLKPSYVNDVSTDNISPPQFIYAYALRDRSHNKLELQSALYGLAEVDQVPGVESLHVDLSLREAFRRASYIVGLEGWTVIKQDAAAGSIEAVSISAIMGFESDVVIRVVSLNESSTVVDIRSSSRELADDFGLNTRQIKGFLAKYRAL